MNERDALFLVHVLDATADIEALTAEGHEVFMSDRKTQSAVIRQLAIIGEAVKNLSPALTLSEPTVPWRQIAGARDRLIHADFSVDLNAVWSMVEQDLPAHSGRRGRALKPARFGTRPVPRSGQN